MRRDNGTPPPRRGEGRPRQREPGKASGGCPLRHRDHGRDTEVGPGSAPLPLHAPPSDGGEERRGARGQGEKSGPIRQGMSVPRLARLRPGPGERDVTTSIDRPQKTGRGAASEAAPPLREEGKRGGDNRPEHEPALQPRHVSPSLSSQAEGEGHGPPGRGPETYRSRRAQARGVRLSLARPGRGGVRPRVAAEKLPGTPPVVQSPEDSVSTAISWYKMPTLGKTWTVPAVGGLCLQITPDSRKRVAATRDPTRPHRHQRRAGGGGQEKGTGLSGRPPPPKARKERASDRRKQEERAGPSTASLTTWHARATGRSNVLPESGL